MRKLFTKKKRRELNIFKKGRKNIFEIDRKCVVRRIIQIQQEDKNTKSVTVPLLIFTVINMIHVPAMNVNILHFITNVREKK